MAGGTNWTEPETLATFRLYCSTPFGKLHQRNPEIVELAQKLGRTPSAVGMKACNFASLDPAHQARGVTGLPNRSKVEEAIWERFQADSGAVAVEAQITRSVRLHQAFFRRTVLSGYGHRCALTGLAHPQLLVASHIIPWSADESRRADPRNGLCLNALADRAFDRGLITLDDDLAVVLGPAMRDPEVGGTLAEHLAGWAGRRLRLPERFEPDGEAVRWHRGRVLAQ